MLTNLTLPTLNFEPAGLAPFINSQTIDIHLNKHHQTYLTNLNNLLPLIQVEGVEFSSLEDLIINVDRVPESKKQAAINNAGQVYNHNLYWNSLTTKANSELAKMSGAFGSALDGFGSYEEFKKQWKEAGLTQFGSGWVWLVTDKDGKLSIEKSSNADNPLFHGREPLMTMDVWEHAYYLDYQNKRADYIDQFFGYINWQFVSDSYDKLIAA